MLVFVNVFEDMTPTKNRLMGLFQTIAFCMRIDVISSYTPYGIKESIHMPRS